MKSRLHHGFDEPNVIYQIEKGFVLGFEPGSNVFEER
jgi:hypothetical protein